jgi:hypothetical protein
LKPAISLSTSLTGVESYAQSRSAVRAPADGVVDEVNKGPVSQYRVPREHLEVSRVFPVTSFLLPNFAFA